MKENELVESCFKLRADGQITAEREDILAAIRSYAATERAGMREACASTFREQFDTAMADTQGDWDGSIKAAIYMVRKLPDTAADEALDNFREAATEAALPLACKAIIESLDGGEFSSASPLAKVAAAIEKVKSAAQAEARETCVKVAMAHNAAARLEEANWWQKYMDINRGYRSALNDPGSRRIAALTAAAKETR